MRKGKGEKIVEKKVSIGKREKKKVKKGVISLYNSLSPFFGNKERKRRAHFGEK